MSISTVTSREIEVWPTPRNLLSILLPLKQTTLDRGDPDAHTELEIALYNAITSDWIDVRVSDTARILALVSAAYDIQMTISPTPTAPEHVMSDSELAEYFRLCGLSGADEAGSGKRRQVRLYPTPRNLLTAIRDVEQDKQPLMTEEQYVALKRVLEILGALVENAVADNEIANFDELKAVLDDSLGIELIATSKPRQGMSNDDLRAYLRDAGVEIDDGWIDNSLDGDLARDSNETMPREPLAQGASNGLDATALMREINDELASQPLSEPPEKKLWVRVITAEDFAHWQRSRKSALSKDDKARISDIAQRIREAGPSFCREIQRIPDDWPALIDGFEEAFPNFVEFARTLRVRFALNERGDRRIDLPPTLLVGPPGIGKTAALRWLAEHLNLPFDSINVATLEISAEINGSDEYWGNTKPGLLFNRIVCGPIANPIVLVDEIDKSHTDSRYNPLSAFYDLFEPLTARHFKDRSFPSLPFDASHVLWVATANSTKTIPKPILSRLNIIEVSPPTRGQGMQIAQHIFDELTANAAWGEGFRGLLDPESLSLLSRLPPRAMRRALERFVGDIALETRDPDAEWEPVTPTTLH